jgi:hypothetical protein
MTRPSISIFLLVVGLLWAAIVLWFLVATGSMVADLRGTLLSYSWLFIGPLLLIAGAILSLGPHHRAGSISLLIGCAVLTVTVGYQSISMLKGFADPLIAKSYGLDVLFAIAALVALLADAGAVQLYRLGAK